MSRRPSARRDRPASIHSRARTRGGAPPGSALRGYPCQFLERVRPGSLQSPRKPLAAPSGSQRAARRLGVRSMEQDSAGWLFIPFPGRTVGLFSRMRSRRSSTATRSADQPACFLSPGEQNERDLRGYRGSWRRRTLRHRARVRSGGVGASVPVHARSTRLCDRCPSATRRGRSCARPHAPWPTDPGRGASALHVRRAP